MQIISSTMNTQCQYFGDCQMSHVVAVGLQAPSGDKFPLEYDRRRL